MRRDHYFLSLGWYKFQLCVNSDKSHMGAKNRNTFHPVQECPSYDGAVHRFPTSVRWTEDSLPIVWNSPNLVKFRKVFTIFLLHGSEMG
jgi:hypothetical protein